MNKKMNILKWIFRFFVLIVACLFVLGEFVLPKEIEDDVCCQPFDVTWTMIREDGSTADIKIPGDYEVNRNEKIIVETVLPEDVEENMYLCFRSNRQDMEIYVDDVLRQSYSTTDSRAFGHSSPGAFVFMKIEGEDGGKTLRVSYQTDSSYSGSLQAIYFGDKMGIWGFLFKERGAEFIVSLLMLILGVVSVVGSLVLRFCYHKPLELEYLGWGVTLAACWMLSDSIFRQIFFSNISIVNDLAFVMVMLLPFPFLIYMNEVQKRRYNAFYVVVSTLVALDIVVCLTLQFLNLVDFVDSIAVFSSFCGLAILLIAVTIIIDCIKGCIGQYKLVAIGILGAAVASVVQLVLYFGKNADSSGVMIAYGMIFLLVISSINTARDILKGEYEKQQAIYANEAKAQFLANMSHEIRTPINAVLGLDEMIIHESTEPNIKEYAMDIQNAGKSLLTLINDILDFSKIESGKMEIVPVEYELSSLIFDCFNMVAMKAKEKKLELILENDTTLPSVLYGDEVRVRQVIVNLLTNAVKYTREGSVKLSVKGQRTENNRLQLQVSVKDTGIGITEEDRAKLFDSFQRVDEKTNRNIEGTGLGLTITMQIVELMQGSISVESEYGKGSVFRVEFPQNIVDDSPMGSLSERVENVIHEEIKDKEKLIAPEGNILVVDDVDLNLKVFCGLLKQTQIQIDTALSGSKALEMAGKKKYHIIFLDHMMPEMDGIETFRALKQMETNPNSDTPVIMLTANAIAGMRDTYLKEGFSDYLSKPVQGNQLIEMIRKYLPAEYILDEENIEEEKDIADTSKKLQGLDFLDTKNGVRFCCNSEEFYLDVLKTYLESEKTQSIKQCYEQQDWENYGIIMHSLKSTSLSIGADEISEHAKNMELAIKEGRLSFIHQEHESLLNEYQELLEKIEAGI